ncbi:MAG: hypothetical protein ACJ797_19465 [Ktedonobacteraceae bacterium]
MQFPLSGLNTVFFALAPGLYKTQQFQKNAYQNDKHLISEKPPGCLWSHLTHTLTRCPIGSLHLDNPQVYPGKPHTMHLEDVPVPKVTERTYVVATVR